jgi:hypothetical protein
MMMESPNFRYGDHLAAVRKMDRARVRAIPSERQMRAKTVVLLEITGQDAHQMLLVQDHHMIQAFAADTPDEPLHVGILPP